MSEPDNSHVMPMLALHLAGIVISVMGAIGLYMTIFNGMRVRDRASGVEWTLTESVIMEAAMLSAGVLVAWFGQRRRNSA